MKSRKNTLTKELLLLCLFSFAVSFVFYKVALTFGVTYISEYYNTEDHIEKLEKKYAKNLQNYVNESEIYVGDLNEIDEWVLAQNDVYLKLFHNGNLVYDTLYGVTEGSDMPEESVKEYGEMRVYSIHFMDGEAEALLFGYDYRIESYARYVMLLLSLIVFLVVFVYGIRKKIRYLVTISREVDRLSEDLHYEVTVQGEDEIATVAKGIDRLRRSVIDQMEREKRAYDTNMNLVTSLSHDIKTPLTSVIGYMELAREKAKQDEEVIQYLNISLEKAMYLKQQTNDLFEHFLLHSNGYQIVFEKVNANELIVQMLEENLLELEAKGVPVKRQISNIAASISVNVNLIYSVFENLFSNLNKYADLSKEVRVGYQLREGYLVVFIENSKKTEKNKNWISTKIGLDNCRAIMGKHKGKLEIEETNERFKVTLWLPYLA